MKILNRNISVVQYRTIRISRLCLKRIGLKIGWTRDLFFLKGMFGGNVLLSTYLHNMPGHPLRQKDICILDAQNAPSPFTTFSLFYDGQFVTHEILSEKKFDKILVSKGL